MDDRGALTSHRLAVVVVIVILVCFDIYLGRAS
jgi:hypothetical protein